jgi:hypothetical protein
MVCPARLVPNESATLKADHAFSQRGDNVRIMRRHKNGDAKLIDLPEQLHDLPADKWIKVASRLISNKEFRVSNDRARNCGTLLLASREGARVSLSERRQPNNTECALNRSVNLFSRCARNLQRKGGVFANRSLLEEAEILKDHANATTQVGNLARLEVVHRMSRNMHLSRNGDNVADKETDQR